MFNERPYSDDNVWQVACLKIEYLSGISNLRISETYICCGPLPPKKVISYVCFISLHLNAR